MTKLQLSWPPQYASSMAGRKRQRAEVRDLVRVREGVRGHFGSSHR